MVDVLKSLEFLALINKNEYKLRKHPNAEIQFILHEWLVDTNETLKNKILDSFMEFSEKYQNKGIPNVDFTSIVIINRISTLRLLEILSSQKTNEISIYKKDNALLLFKLYLLVSKEISNRQEKVFHKYFVNKRSPIDDIYFHLFYGLTQPILQSSQSKWLTPEIYKFLLFEKWLKSNNEYYKMSENYLKLIGLNNWQEYFNNVFSLSKISTQAHRISIKNNPILENLINYFASNNDFNPQWAEFVNLKKQPIVKLDKDLYLILDFEFLLNKFFTSLYHDILNFSKTSFGNKFSQDYNDLFVENILLVNTFKSVFGKSYIRYSEIDIKKNNIKGINSLGLPDYYIRNGNKVFLFECKNSFISNANKINLDTELLLEEIKTKFYFVVNEKTNKSKDKAIKQLTNYILNSFAYKYNFFDEVKNTNKLVYYPILIVTDYTLCSLGFNQLLNTYFKEEIKSLDSNLKQKIKPLTIIHIDDFLYHQTRLKKLDDVIIKHHNYLKNKNGFDLMISFSDYIDSEHHKEKPPLSKKNIQHILDGSLLPEE